MERLSLCSLIPFEDSQLVRIEATVITLDPSMSICCNGGTAEAPCPCQFTQADLKEANLGFFDNSTAGLLVVGIAMVFILGVSLLLQVYGLHTRGIAPAPGNIHARWDVIPNSSTDVN